MTIPEHIRRRFDPPVDDALRRLLALPEGPVRVILDTDAANEIDDQFALAWALLSADRIRLEGVTAEPYSHAYHRPGLLRARAVLRGGGPSTAEEEDQVRPYRAWLEGLAAQGRDPADLDFVTPAEGMEQSYQEILRIYDKLGLDGRPAAYRGAAGYLTSLDHPVESDAASRIVERALATTDQPLYLCAIGCVTNIASALLLEPAIVRNVVVLWTAGQATTSRQDNRGAFNMVQDVLAAQLLFDCGVAMVYLPGFHIGAQLRLSLPDMETWVRGKGALGDYLYHLYTHNPIHAQRGVEDIAWRTWVIWDVINIAWLLNPAWVPTSLLPAPVLADDLSWRHPPGRHLMREAHGIDRDAIFRDFFCRLAAAA